MRLIWWISFKGAVLATAIYVAALIVAAAVKGSRPGLDGAGFGTMLAAVSLIGILAGTLAGGLSIKLASFVLPLHRIADKPLWWSIAAGAALGLVVGGLLFAYLFKGWNVPAFYALGALYGACAGLFWGLGNRS